MTWLVTLDNHLCISPIATNQAPQSVLDVGTGTGAWAIEFAKRNPSSRVIGTDLSVIQPANVPVNCEFRIENAEVDWTFNEPFDFIHSRMLCLGIHDWPQYFRRCFDGLKPGGWLEEQEIQGTVLSSDGSAGPESALFKWAELIMRAAEMGGVDTRANNKFSQQLKEQGFVNIVERVYEWPIGEWPEAPKAKEIGKATKMNLLKGLEGLSLLLLTKNLGWTRQQVETFIGEVRQDINNPKKHFHHVL